MGGLPFEAIDSELADVIFLFALAAFALLAHVTQVSGWHRGMKAPFRSGTTDDSHAIRLSVVLPVRNEAGTLPRLLKDLTHQCHQPDEVLIVDDASEDGTQEAVMSCDWPFALRILDNPGRGKKAGLSAGIRAARQAWVVQVDADTRLGPQALATVAEEIAQHGEGFDMALLPLRLGHIAKGAPERRFDRLQALDFAAMQGWAVVAVDRNHPAMASGGGWVWRAKAFPHDALRPDIPSGDDVFSLAALIERGDRHRVGRITHAAAMVSAAPMPDLPSLLDQRIRWGAKSTHYPKALGEARKVALTVATVHAFGAALLVLAPKAGLAFWSVKSGVDMTYTARAGRAYGLLPPSRGEAALDLVALAVVHPLFIATTLLLMPFRTARWKGRRAT